MKKSFEQWLAAVDAILASKLGGMTSEEIPDCPYCQWFEDGMSPKRAAAKAIASI